MSKLVPKAWRGFCIMLALLPALGGLSACRATGDTNLKDSQYRLYRYVGHTQASRSADAQLARQLDELGLEYKVDERFDYRVNLPIKGSQRKQQVFLTSGLETGNGRRLREIWSTAYHTPASTFSALIANRLLEASADLVQGGFVKEKQNAVFVIRIRADADNDELKEAIDAVARTTDDMERELADGADNY